MTPGARAFVAVFLLVPVLAACDAEPGPPDAGAPASDTGAMDGLTSEEVERQVEPMTLEEARQRGIVDTTEVQPPAPVGPEDPIPGTPPPVGGADTVGPG